MCAFFNGLENFSNVSDQCQFNSGESISLYFKNEQLKENCQKYPEHSCFLIIKITGKLNNKFTLGYTYNDKPFKLVKESIIRGPFITKGSYRLNFIQHLEKNTDELISFNAKGLDMNIYTKLIDGEKLGDALIIPFPYNLDSDSVERKTDGNLTSIFYSKEKIATFGKNPELLISIRPNPNTDISDDIFDGKFQF
jgi:hypothetical protein